MGENKEKILKDVNFANTIFAVIAAVFGKKIKKNKVIFYPGYEVFNLTPDGEKIFVHYIRTENDKNFENALICSNEQAVRFKKNSEIECQIMEPVLFMIKGGCEFVINVTKVESIGVEVIDMMVMKKIYGLIDADDKRIFGKYIIKSFLKKLRR